MKKALTVIFILCSLGGYSQIISIIDSSSNLWAINQNTTARSKLTNQSTTGTAAGLSATLAISSGGTAATTAAGARAAILPSMAGNSLKVLRVNAGETDYELATNSASVAWGGITGTLSNQTDLQNALDGKQASGSYQPLDADLTTIAGLTATTDNFIVAVSGAWASRTPAQAKTSLALVKADVGLGSVDNTSDAGKPVSTSQQTALDLKANLASPTFTGTVGGITSTMVGLGNVTNESKATMFTNATFTGTFATAAGAISNAALSNAAVANLSGTNTGDNTVSTSGAATTAVTLLTPRAINGTNFDGSAAITVTAAGSTLTGTVVGSATSTSLNSTILASSLTSVGTLASPVLTTPTINGSKTTGVNRFACAVVTGNTARTLSGAEMAAGSVQELTGTTARIFTLDNGTNLSTAVPGVAVGDAIMFYVKNSGTSTGTITMAGGTGTTLSSTAVIAIGTSRVFYAVNTGANAWTIY